VLYTRSGPEIGVAATKTFLAGVELIPAEPYRLLRVDQSGRHRSQAAA
jgi:hypothetical protein